MKSMNHYAGLNNKQFGVAAVFCRVSTHDQRELSLDSQELAVRKELEAQGYSVPDQFVIKLDWSSLDLMSCPEFQQLSNGLCDPLYCGSHQHPPLQW